LYSVSHFSQVSFTPPTPPSRVLIRSSVSMNPAAIPEPPAA
jgi:hypothetical protein